MGSGKLRLGAIQLTGDMHACGLKGLDFLFGLTLLNMQSVFRTSAASFFLRNLLLQPLRANSLSLERLNKTSMILLLFGKCFNICNAPFIASLLEAIDVFLILAVFY